MAPRKPPPYREVKRKLEAAGFVEGQQRGSHVTFVKTSIDGVRTAIVPKHREISLGTLRSVLRQAGLDPTEFERL